jgi:glucokinase
MFDRQLVQGAHNFAGELGHMVLHPAGRACNCGQAGCVEQYLSGPGLLATARQYHPDVATPEEVVAAATIGAPWALRSLDRFSQDLALVLTSLVNLLDPDLFVLAGGLATTHPYWDEPLASHLAKIARKSVPLAYSQFGDDAPLVGAVNLFHSHFSPSDA